MPVDRYHYQRIYVRRKHVWEDTLNAFKSGLDFGKYIKVTFAGSPAVDDGGPLREFLRLMMGSIAMNNMLFQGESTLRVPTCNVAGLENKLYERIGEMISVSLIHGGPAPTFFAPSMVDYIVYGSINKVNPSVNEVPNVHIRKKLEEVS